MVILFQSYDWSKITFVDSPLKYNGGRQDEAKNDQISIKEQTITITDYHLPIFTYYWYYNYYIILIVI